MYICKFYRLDLQSLSIVETAYKTVFIFKIKYLLLPADVKIRVLANLFSKTRV